MARHISSVSSCSVLQRSRARLPAESTRRAWLARASLCSLSVDVGGHGVEGVGQPADIVLGVGQSGASGEIAAAEAGNCLEERSQGPHQQFFAAPEHQPQRQQQHRRGNGTAR